MNAARFLQLLIWSCIAVAIGLSAAMIFTGCTASHAPPTPCELACAHMRDIGCATDHPTFEDDCNDSCPTLVQKKIFTTEILQCISELPQQTATCANVSDCAPGL